MVASHLARLVCFAVVVEGRVFDIRWTQGAEDSLEWGNLNGAVLPWVRCLWGRVCARCPRCGLAAPSADDFRFRNERPCFARGLGQLERPAKALPLVSRKPRGVGAYVGARGGAPCAAKADVTSSNRRRCTVAVDPVLRRVSRDDHKPPSAVRFV